MRHFVICYCVCTPHVIYSMPQNCFVASNVVELLQTILINLHSQCWKITDALYHFASSGRNAVRIYHQLRHSRRRFVSSYLLPVQLPTVSTTKCDILLKHYLSFTFGAFKHKIHRNWSNTVEIS